MKSHLKGCLKMFNWRQDAARTRRQDACATPGSAGVLACGFTELPSSVFQTGIFRQAREIFHADIISFSSPAVLIPSSAPGMTNVGRPSGFGSFVVASTPICA